MARAPKGETPIAEPQAWHITADGIVAGVLTRACDAMAQQAESEAERQMIPHLFCAVCGLISLFGVEEIEITQQKEVEHVGRVDWCLVAYKGNGRADVILEVDGLAYHNGQESFAKDRQRDRAALRDGWVTIRFAAVEVQQLGWSCGVELHNTIAGLLPAAAAEQNTTAPAEPAA